ncbi:MAG: multidrug effflux MFS transporter [Gammaproteobacteria bacterium]|nr:multidrug effflux MFS transporter [Gammaproteobacteria bacterium]
MSEPHSQRFMLWITLIVAMLAMLAPFSIDTYMPSFPAIAGELSATALQMQQTMSFYMAGFAIMNLFYGSLADAYGRRSVALLALLGYAAVSVACALVTDIDTLLWLRAGQGAFAAAGVVVGRALVRDLFDGAQAQKVMSASMFWFALAPALAPVIGGWLHTQWGWRSVFWFLTALALTLFLLILFRLKETLAKEQRTSMHPVYLFRMYWKVSLNLRFMMISISSAMFFAGFFLYITSAPTMVYEHLALGVNDFGYLFAILVLGIMIGSRLSGRMAGIWSQQQLMTVGYALMLVAAGINVVQSVLFLPSFLTTILPVSFYAAGMALLLPSFTIMALDCFPKNRGLASSLMGFIQMGSNAVVAGLVTPLLYHSVPQLALGMMGFVLLSVGLYWIGVHRPATA